MGGPLPIVVFVLVAFAAFAIPSILAYVLFNLIRNDPPPPPDAGTPRHARRKVARHATAVRDRLTTHQRFGRA